MSRSNPDRGLRYEILRAFPSKLLASFGGAYLMQWGEEPFRAAAGKAFAAAVESYQSWLRQLWAGGANHGASPQAAQTLAASLTAELSGWLRRTHPLAHAGLGEAAGGARVQQLLGEWTAAQSRLALHWATIAQSAVQNFIDRAGRSPAPLGPDALRHQYDVWIECAESAYAATVGSQQYCADQAALINATAALTAEVRQHAGFLARAFDLPTRAEVNALHARVSKLEASTPKTRTRKPSRARTGGKRHSRSRKQRS